MPTMHQAGWDVCAHCHKEAGKVRYAYIQTHNCQPKFQSGRNTHPICLLDQLIRDVPLLCKVSIAARIIMPTRDTQSAKTM